jgi:hypothetical protein
MNVDGLKVEINVSETGVFGGGCRDALFGPFSHDFRSESAFVADFGVL